MQDLLLYSQITASRHSQALQIFAGITASPPTSTLEQHLIFEQTKLPPAPKKNQTNVNPRRTYQHLVRRPQESPAWLLRITDVPEPGYKQTLSQSVTEVPVPESEMKKFRPDSEWYRAITNYCVAAHRFVQGNIVISVQRIHTGELSNESVLDSTPPSTASGPPLDPSGSYIIEACVRLEDGSSTALRDQATKELLAFAESLRGAIDLRVPDRLALDPRVKGP